MTVIIDFAWIIAWRVVLWVDYDDEGFMAFEG